MERAASERQILCMSGEMTGNHSWTRERGQVWSFELYVGGSGGERAPDVYGALHEFSVLNPKSVGHCGQTYNQGASCAL